LGKKLLIVRPVNVDGSDTTGYVVAVDTVGAGYHERVLVVAGSSARLAQGMKDVPVDAAIVGVIDTVDVLQNYDATRARDRHSRGHSEERFTRGAKAVARADSQMETRAVTQADGCCRRDWRGCWRAGV